MNIDTLKEAATRVLDEEFERVAGNLRSGWITPALASLLFEHFGRAQERLINEAVKATGDSAIYGLPYIEYCQRLNPSHSDTMIAYRTAKPADLASTRCSTVDVRTRVPPPSDNPSNRYTPT